MVNQSERGNNKRSVSIESLLGVEALVFDQLFEQVRNKPLGSGSFGAVYVVQHKITKEEFAAKVIDRR